MLVTALFRAFVPSPSEGLIADVYAMLPYADGTSRWVPCDSVVCKRSLARTEGAEGLAVMNGEYALSSVTVVRERGGTGCEEMC